MTGRGLRSKISALLACAALAASPAPADWLVTKDGAKIETKGPWKVDGRRVLFTQTNGTLSAMRASEIDFEASEAATTAALAPPPSAPSVAVKEPLPEPVLVLTNKDIAAAAVEESGEAQPETLPSIADREPVQVISWNRYDVEDGIELRGTVRNTGASVAANIRVRASVKDEEGTEIATGNAFLGNSSLVSGRSTTFRIVLPEVDDFDGNPEFAVTSSRVTIGGAARPRTQGDDASQDQSADPSADDGDSDDDFADDASQEGEFDDEERP